MKKLTRAFLVLTFLLSMAGYVRAEATVVPEDSDPRACDAARKNRVDTIYCNRWYYMVEDPQPDACLYGREARERCWRWYHVGAERPRVEAKKITIDQMIHFDFNKSNIRKDAQPILDDVATILKNNPQVKRMRIESHTDAIGTEAYNMKLSERRANSTKDYLVNKGIDASRLEAVGYGKTRPIATNKTAAGRAMNRRSEFNVLD